jgi:hypothetical protein
MQISEKQRARFVAYHDIGDSSECWLWRAGKTPKGYGAFFDTDAKQTFRAHRYSYLMHKGDIP